MSSSTPQSFPVAAEGAEFNPSNIFKFIAAVSPIILTWFLAAASIFNQDIKGIIYLAGILIAICINVLLSNMIKSKPFPERNAVCEIFNLPFTSNYNSPSVNSMIIAFTAAYLIAPMRENNQMNYGIVAFLAVILVIDGVTKVTNYCTPTAGVILGTVLGYMLGYMWFALFKATGNDSLLYFNETLSNSAVCSVPKKQTFKCSVFKNGELVESL
jgi:hypothetical protein